MRNRGGPWLLLLPVLFMVVAATWLARGERGRTTSRSRPPPAETGARDKVRAFTVEFEHGARRVTARLTPLHGEASIEAHEARVLARRFALPPGEPWRLELSGLDRPPARSAQVEDLQGLALAPLADFLAGGDPSPAIDPLRSLFIADGARVEGGARSILLWGRAPGSAPALVLHLGSDLRSSFPLVPGDVACASLPRHLARLEPDSGDPSEAPDEEDSGR